MHMLKLTNVKTMGKSNIVKEKGTTKNWHFNTGVFTPKPRLLRDKLHQSVSLGED